MMSRLWLLAAIVALAVPGAAAGQNPVQGSAAQSPAQGAAAQSPLQGALQSQNKDQPIHIEAATLEVHDKAKTATFSGNVQVVQGDTTMRCRSLVVFYGAEEGAGTAAKPAAARPAAGGPATPGMPQGAQSIRRIEARGGVTVVAKDQNASGELGVYDLKTKTITLTGNVVVSQGKNVLHGERVVVDTATGNARVESGATTHDRVRALIQPGKGANGTPTNVMPFGQGHPN
jgi:lipopolysaccharide export system protein LptA